jgi:hypothetical protein
MRKKLKQQWSSMPLNHVPKAISQAMSSHMEMKMVNTQKALSMGLAQHVSAVTMIRSDGTLPKMRTTCRATKHKNSGIPGRINGFDRCNTRCLR